MIRVLVTGATGFLGTALCRKLVDMGFEVTGLGRNPERLRHLEAIGVTTRNIDLSTAYHTNATTDIGAHDIVVHTAARSAPFGAWEHFMRDNVQGARSVLSLAYNANAQRIINISSPAVYFRPKNQWLVAENHALPAPVNSYARSKDIAERILSEPCGLDVITLRPRGIYGPGDTALLPRLLEAAQRGPLPLLNGGRAETDLTHVDDVVQAILASIAAPAKNTHRIYNISGGQPKRIVDVIEKIASATATDIRWKPLPLSIATAAALTFQTAARLRRYDHEPRLTRYTVGLLAWTQTLDISKAQRELGWTPGVDIDDGIESTLEHLT